MADSSFWRRRAPIWLRVLLGLLILPVIWAAFALLLQASLPSIKSSATVAVLFLLQAQLSPVSSAGSSSEEPRLASRRASQPSLYSPMPWPCLPPFPPTKDTIPKSRRQERLDRSLADPRTAKRQPCLSSPGRRLRRLPPTCCLTPCWRDIRPWGKPSRRSFRRSSAADTSSAASFAPRTAAWHWSPGSNGSMRTAPHSSKTSGGREVGSTINRPKACLSSCGACSMWTPVITG